MQLGSYNNEEFNEFGINVDKKIIQIAAWQSFILGNKLDIDKSKTIRESKFVEEFLQTPLNNKTEEILKKIFATSVIVAKDKEKIPLSISKNPIEIASAIDQGLTSTKIAYKTAIGELDSVEAMDSMVDRVAVRVTAVTDKIIEKGVPFVTKKVFDVAKSVCPPVKILEPVVKKVSEYTTEFTKKAVRKGVQMLADVVKPIVKKVDAVLKTVKSTAKKIFSFFGF